jgi:hypothetical protein
MSKKPIRITRYRVDRWGNKVTGESLYGVSVKVEGIKGYCRISENGAAVLKDTMTEAEAYIEQMKSERDAQGFKIPTDTLALSPHDGKATP